MHVVVFLQQRLRWLPAFARRRRHKVPDGSRNKVQAGGAEEEAVGGSLPRRRRRREGGLYLLHLVGPAQAPPPLQAGKQEPRGRGGGEVVGLVFVPLVAGVHGAKTVVCTGEVLQCLTTADCCIGTFLLSEIFRPPPSGQYWSFRLLSTWRSSPSPSLSPPTMGMQRQQQASS